MVLSEIMTFLCSTITNIFTMLDTVEIDGFTVLDVFVAIMFLEVVINFITEFRRPEN